MSEADLKHIESLRGQLARARMNKEILEKAWTMVLETCRSENAELAQSFDDAKAFATSLEADLRGAVERWWESSDKTTKTPSDGIGIRVVNEISITNREMAIEYVREKLPHLLDFNQSGLEKVLTTMPNLPIWATRTTTGRAVIGKSLPLPLPGDEPLADPS